MQNYQNFDFISKFQKNCAYLRGFCGKTEGGGLGRVKFWSFLSCNICKKKVQNSFFVSAALHCEIIIGTNKIFVEDFLSHSKYSTVWLNIQLIPNLNHFLPIACLNSNWVYFCCVQLVPKYMSKVKLDRGQSPNILSEIIILGENGICGGKIPISHFLKSWAHSALWWGGIKSDLSYPLFSAICCLPRLPWDSDDPTRSNLFKDQPMNGRLRNQSM